MRIIKSFLIKECPIAINPSDPTDTNSFGNFYELVESFLLFLNHKTVSPELADTGNKILGAISIYASSSIDVDKLSNGIETLSAGFESFLKKIAEVKFGQDSILFKGDGVDYLGFVKTTLGKLLQGEVAKVNPKDTRIPKLVQPIVAFSYSSPLIKDKVYNYIRLLRNEVHVSPNRTISECLTSFKHCVSAYFYATHENISIIRQTVDPVFIYLDSTRKKFYSLNNLFVDIESEASIENKIELPDLDAIQFFPEPSASVQVGDLAKKPITILLKEDTNVWLIGEPGSGKTTSLQVSVLSVADEILMSGYIATKKIPVYLAVRLINESRSLIKFIQDTLRVSADELDRLLALGKLKIVLDGINEVSESIQIKLQDEIINLVGEYEEITINISSRRYGFTKTLEFPTFELLPLSLPQIDEYIRKYVRDSQGAENLINQLKLSDELILDFAKNPLLLKMLIQVGLKENIQPNFGLLFQKFVNWLLERERRKEAQIDINLKEKILAELAFKMRLKLARAIDYDQAVAIVDQSIEKLREKIGAITFLDQVLDNRILVRDSEKQLSFFHELVLEYYTALKLQGLYYFDPEKALEFSIQPEWYESVIILSGILKNPDDLVDRLSLTNIILAARCIASGSKISEQTSSSVFRECQKRLLNENTNELETITALLELSSNDSFRLVVKHLAMRKHSFTKALSHCQRPELIALKLLNFGLTGKNRIRQCLKVFVNRPNSKSFIDSDTIGNAQLILITGKIEIEDIFLIRSLGISVKALEKIKKRIEVIIYEADTSSKLFAETCEMVGGFDSLMDLRPQINLRVKDKFEKYKTGSELYHAFRILNVLRKFSVDGNKELAELLCERALSQGFFNLLLLYLKSFDVDKRAYIAQVVPLIIAKGKVAAIVAFKNSFPDIVSNQDLLNVFRSRLLKGFIQEVFQLVELIHPLLSNKDKLDLINSIIAAREKSLSFSKLATLIGRLELGEKFQNMAAITTLNQQKGTGFARRLSDGTSYFIKIGKTDSEIMLKTIILFDDKDVIAYTNDEKGDKKWLRPRIKSFTVVSSLS